MLYSIFLIGLFLLIVESVLVCLSSLDVFALHMVKRRCATHILMNCVDEGTVKDIVLGTVVVETSWGEHVCQVLVLVFEHKQWTSFADCLRGRVILYGSVADGGRRHLTLRA